jgi:hypothetical protein
VEIGDQEIILGYIMEFDTIAATPGRVIEKE